MYVRTAGRAVILFLFLWYIITAAAAVPRQFSANEEKLRFVLFSQSLKEVPQTKKPVPWNLSVYMKCGFNL